MILVRYFVEDTSELPMVHTVTLVKACCSISLENMTHRYLPHPNTTTQFWTACMVFGPYSSPKLGGGHQRKT